MNMIKKLSSLPRRQLDIIILTILTLMSTLLIFFRIGNMTAPVTSFASDHKNAEIVLDFGAYTGTGKLYIFLGNLDRIHLTVSVFNEVSGEWEVIIPDAEFPSVFQWNSVDLYYKTRYLGLVSTSDELVLNEIVVTDVDGHIITPVNTQDYPALFDEQDTFFDTDQPTCMDGTMFDEVYHARTGYEFVHHLPTYETTHPQLGKCLIALGILIFGMNPFGWRFFAGVFGVLLVVLIYLFARRMFKSIFAGAFTGLLLAFDCMHYTLARIATIDTFAAFFIVAAYYYMYRYVSSDEDHPLKMLALSGVHMGLAVATKLTGVYAGAGHAVIFFAYLFFRRPWISGGQLVRLFFFCCLFFIVVPLTVYVLAYLPAVEKYASMGYTDRTVSWTADGLQIGYGWTGVIARAVRNTTYMLSYHKGLKATHPFSSPFYTWPFVIRPLLASNAQVSSDPLFYSAVSYVGNVVIWWGCIPCILFTFFKAITARDCKAMFLAAAWLAQYIPWMGVSRITFIYHYYPAFIFSVLMAGYTADTLSRCNIKTRRAIYAYLGLAAVAFILFFPAISGFPVSYGYLHHLNLLPSWQLI